MFSRPVHAVHLSQFTLPITSDSLTLLAIILDVSAIFCARFAIPTMFCDLLAIIIYLLCFLMISGTFTSTPQPFPSSTLISATQQPHTSEPRSETSQTSHITPSTCPITMPLRRDHSAPHFDPSRPRELRRYFADLAVHFAQSEIDSDQEKKHYTCRYVDIDTEELWESRLEYSDGAKSFAEFVQAIYRLYPGAEGRQQWLVADMEKLVEERSRISIRTLGDLGDYYRRFIAITTFLCGRNWLSDRDQSQAFMRGLSCDLCDRVLRRLQLKFPDHLYDDPYRLDDIYEAAQFILHGTATSVSITATLCDPLIGSALPGIAEHCIKSPDIIKHHPSLREVGNHRTSSPSIAGDHIGSPEVVEDRLTSPEAIQYCPTSFRTADHHLTLRKVGKPCGTSADMVEHRAGSHDIGARHVTSPEVAAHHVTSPRSAEHCPTSFRTADHHLTLRKVGKLCETSADVVEHRAGSRDIGARHVTSPEAPEHHVTSPEAIWHCPTSLRTADHHLTLRKVGKPCRTSADIVEHRAGSRDIGARHRRTLPDIGFTADWIGK
ncbi:hypothetical protein PILCRDRAFT_17346 [Piloderma croceum F 1598]|uniref:Uncharacterized protein n=1 Tax=Piloderma croceum (strain F 1598) TaxID=765440 RepID=A0A0C3B1M8_PILCF|nr:hypothetical protein PILCRDRAFT_17346 [Piloderma croceum F 1598]